MTGFSADWLSLREPADRDARPLRLIDWIARDLQTKTPHILDLGAGTGSNLRYLAPRLGGMQQWVLADHDPGLLDAIPLRLAEWARLQSFELKNDAQELCLHGVALDCRIGRLHVDLAAHLGTIDFKGLDLVTAAALLDLVSAPWLEALVRRCVDAGCAVLFALSYDGRIQFSPAEPQDARVRELVNQHQRTDKGFGLALGPDAAANAIELLQLLGYEVMAERSDWRIGDTQRQLQSELIAGWAAAASAMSPAEAVAISAWRDSRLTHVQSGRSCVGVGHMDVAARPSSGVTIGAGNVRVTRVPP
jgi:SAM-dependent methyltransferase